MNDIGGGDRQVDGALHRCYNIWVRCPEWLIDIYKHRYARTLAVASVIVTITIDAATMVREIYKYRGLRACSHAVDHYFEQTIGVCEGVVVVGNHLRGKIIKVCGIGECSLDICGCETCKGLGISVCINCATR